MKPIDVMRFRSMGAIVNPLAGGAISSTSYNDAGNTSSITFLAGGGISASTDGLYPSDNISGQFWFAGGTPASEYEIRATSQSLVGTGSSSGTLGTWLSLLSNRGWSETKPSGNGGRTRTILFEIRDKATTTVVTSGTYTISALNSTGDPP